MSTEKLKPTVRMLKLLQLLARHADDGLRPMQIATALHVEPSMVTRDMQDLAGEGFAERVPGREECWRLGPAALRTLRTHMLGLERAQARLQEAEDRATRGFLG